MTKIKHSKSNTSPFKCYKCNSEKHVESNNRCGDGSILQVPSKEESGETAEKFELRMLFDALG
jgi:hypothetical protein